MAMVRRGAAKIIEEKELTAEKLTAMADETLSHPEQLKEIGENAKKMAVTNASQLIADVIIKLAKGGR